MANLQKLKGIRGMEVEIYNEFNDKLNHLWKNLESNSNSPAFQSYAWQRYWYDQVGKTSCNIVACIAVCSKQGRLQVIFPFCIQRVMGARVLEFLGGKDADYQAPLVDSKMTSALFKEIWSEVLKVLPPYDVINFINIPKVIETNTNFLLENVSASATGFAYSSSLPDTFVDYSSRLSKSMLKDNKRMMRRLSEMGELKFSVIDAPQEFDHVLETMMAQKIERYELSNSRNIFLDKSIKAFYTNIGILYRRGLSIHLSTLSLDQEILATHLGLHYGGRFYYLMPTFNHDKKWRKFSLGRIHLEKLVDWAIENQMNTFDFTIGAEAYKNIWCDSEMPLYRHFKVRSLRGIGYYLYDILINVVKKNPRLKTLAVKLLSLQHKIFTR